MKSITLHEAVFKNVDRPFTELFSIMKRYESTSQGNVKLVYSDTELRLLHQHTGNAKDALLRGLQCFGQLMCNSKDINEDILVDAGLFISTVSDLVDALTVVRDDVHYSK